MRLTETFIMGMFLLYMFIILDSYKNVKKKRNKQQMHEKNYDCVHV